ncbi:hypothetical protein HUT18_11965 [Streptomyces sp. NA04227]|uniref:hypothetical protein n=1 Tax=Streptomyces sp. NA04227 TaxID=2742136 RepID=UPI0015921DFC|nr:hypothetical protein [Streptomyces sp. NA04227]QKW07014.1 hypothetical protein HUT18_11965 [Streptomyces sp. NA04227]
MTGRAYCRCTSVRNYDYNEAAQKLKCNRRFLEDNIKRLPHQKIGQQPSFCECELALIQAMFTVIPPGLFDEPVQIPPTPELAALRPSGRRRQRAAS